MVVIAIGSENPAKLRAAHIVIDKLKPYLVKGNDEEIIIKGITVPSEVSNQPKSSEETKLGAINRARNALKKCEEALKGSRDTCIFGIGMEGGIEQVGSEWYECGWMAVVNCDGVLGIGSTARAPVSKTIVNRLFNGEELSQVVDDLSGENDVRSSQGFMGLVTNGALPRDECYTHGLYFAFAPFVSGKQFWD